MNEQLLKMNGLSVEILDTLSFESHLGCLLYTSDAADD